MPSNVTIVIPTYNRPRQLDRQLNFLEYAKNQFPVIVVDGTNEAATRELNRGVAKRHPSVQMRQYEQDRHFGLRISDGAKAADTEYVLVSADDDFAFPPAIRECADFLDAHPDYSAAIGETFALSYNLSRPVTRRGFAILDRLNTGTAPNQPRFLQRSMWYFAYTTLGYIPLFYSLRRAQEVATSFGNVTPVMKHSSTELITNSLLLIHGRVAVLPIPFGLRDYSSEPIREAIRQGETQHCPEEDLAHIRPLLVEAVAEREHLAPEMAGYVIDVHLEQWSRDIQMRSTVSNQPPMRYQRFARLLQIALSIVSPRRLANQVSIDPHIILALRRAHVDYCRGQA